MAQVADGVEIRRAAPGDAPDLTLIAFAAKRYWGYPERWIHAWRDALTILPDFVRENEVYAAFAEGEPVGFYALAGEGMGVELAHLWVLPAWIGHGLGRALFEHALRRAAARGAQTVKIEADPNAEGFYLRMGARRTGESVSELEGRERALPVLSMTVPSG